MKKTTICTAFLLIGLNTSLLAQNTIKYYLSGTDKDHTITWDFYCSYGMKSGIWSKIQVPSQWEQQGFGSYNYGHDREKADAQGIYKYKFKTDKAWSGKNIFIVFEGSMTDTEVEINGQSAGAVHQGGFYRFKYEISSLLKYGEENLLEVTVNKMSADASVNKAERNGDFWILSGIYRPVYLEVMPEIYIDRVAIDAKADGVFSVDVYAKKLSSKNTIEVQIQKLSGENEGKPISIAVKESNEKQTLKQKFENISQWNPEFPKLYQAVIALKDVNGTVVHKVKQRFGFRTMELRLKDGIYVNNKKVILKGVNRHSAWPETGRTLSREIHLLDINLIKDMNMNAVRMSHYPPDQEFLDLCDSLGLFVIDELTGWQAKYDTIPGRKLVKELVIRDVNHPSVIMWANGNEGGWNTGLDNDYHLYDPQKRLVMHPWEKFNGTDTKHYPNYNYVVNTTLYGKEVFFPTEFMHGLYDGGHAAGLDDFWNLMLQHPYNAGGFLWAFHDEGIARTDKNGIIDTDRNHAPDGIVGPYREKEGSYYAIKEIWSPIYINQRSIEPEFNGKLKIENRYIYTNLNQCTFEWKLATFPSPTENTTKAIINAVGNTQTLNVSAGLTGVLNLNLPVNWQKNDALYLTAYDSNKHEIFTWSWAIAKPLAVSSKYTTTKSTSKSKIEVTDLDSNLIVKSDSIAYYFDKKTGYLSKVVKRNTDISLSNGPVLAGIKHTLKQIKHYQQGESYVVEPVYEGDSWFYVKWTFSPGLPAKLEYKYSQKGEADFMGVTFNYPESKITGMKWMGRGPYRVWKNRLKGLQFGVWEKDYNNSVTGEIWNYPEFKGYHAELNWVVIKNKEANFTVYTENEGLFLQIYKPSKPVNAPNDYTNPPFPEGNIGFLNAISPIGTKFQAASEMGPQSQKNMQLNYVPFSEVLWFDFR